VSPKPRTLSRAAWDAAPVAAALALNPLAAAVAPDDPAVPVARAWDVVELQRSLGLFFEADVYAWTSQHAWLLTLASVFYLWVHVPATLGALIWAWLERPRAFPVVRNVFLVAQALTVLGYVLLPTAPPRLLDGLGFEDTLAAFWGAGGSEAAHTVQSPYAAVPSGHVVFALVAGGTVALLARPLAVRLLAAAYPPLVVLVTIATANHFWFDAASAALVCLVAVALVAAWPAVRRRLPRVALRRPAHDLRRPEVAHHGP
jgi:hypothetical protein